MDDQRQDPATNISLNEECDEEGGYANWCVDANNEKIRCRLCGTCLTSGTIRWKRSGSGTRCKRCPSQEINRLLLGVGFLVMVVGSAAMVYMEITSETSSDETSDAVKKILINFLQMISLASGLPLQWPAEIETMFQGFVTLSSAGSNLMIPDCELTDMKTSDAFYMKQIGFTFLPMCVVVVCVLSWSLIWCCCARRCRLKLPKIQDYTILSIVLMLFLSYSMLVRLCFSMFKCPFVGGVPYLMADLQEPCYTGRHLAYIGYVTVPQLILYVFGLPLMATMKILRNRNHLHKRQFYVRYGLLYMGYRDGRKYTIAVEYI